MVIPETDDEKMACLEAALLQDLSLCRHKQVLHPVLQEGEFTHFLETVTDTAHHFIHSILNFSGVEVELSGPRQAHWPGVSWHSSTTTFPRPSTAKQNHFSLWYVTIIPNSVILLVSIFYVIAWFNFCLCNLTVTTEQRQHSASLFFYLWCKW